MNAVIESALVVEGHKEHPECYGIATTQDDVMINMISLNDALYPVMLMDTVQT